MARTLDVYLHDALVGQLIQDDGGQTVFEYADAWLRQPGAMALSVSLPLGKKRFGRNECCGFFAGVLKNRSAKSSPATWASVRATTSPCSSASAVSAQALPRRRQARPSVLRATHRHQSAAFHVRLRGTITLNFLIVMNQDQVEVIESSELAKRLNVPEIWIRSRTNAKRTTGPIPHLRLWRYVRFPWVSSELRDWLVRQLVSASGQGHQRRKNDQNRS